MAERRILDRSRVYLCAGGFRIRASLLDGSIPFCHCRLERKNGRIRVVKYATEKHVKLVKNACFFYRVFGKSEFSCDKNQDILFSVHSYGPNTGTEALSKERLEAAGECHEACAKTLDPLFAPPRFIEQSLQSHVRAVRTSRPLACQHSAQNSGYEHADLQYHCRDRLL